MAKDKKLVESITSMDEDFAQWYTDVVKKAELCSYTSVKGCMAISEKRMVDCIRSFSDGVMLLMKTMLAGLAVFLVSLAMITASVRGG